MHNHLTIKFLIIVTFTFFMNESFTQSDVISPYQVIVESIESLESNRDPKCHATASRLENFMFGTPLTPEAREHRIELQKLMVRYI